MLGLIEIRHKVLIIRCFTSSTLQSITKTHSGFESEVKQILDLSARRTKKEDKNGAS